MANYTIKSISTNTLTFISQPYDSNYPYSTTNIKQFGSVLAFRKPFSNPNTDNFSSLGNINIQDGGVDIGTLICPKYTEYTSSATHICAANATGVYIILVGAGGGGGSGGAQSGYGGDGGNGGGGGQLYGAQIMRGTNQSFDNTITINIGAAGGGAVAVTSNTRGNTGGNGGNTTAVFTIGPNTYTVTGYGGGGGGGGGGGNASDTNGAVGAGGSATTNSGSLSCSYTVIANGSNGSKGVEGTGGDSFDPAGGAGGAGGITNNALGHYVFNMLGSTWYGAGGNGGGGDGTGSDNGAYGHAGYAGTAGVAWVFEYFT